MLSSPRSRLVTGFVAGLLIFRLLASRVEAEQYPKLTAEGLPNVRSESAFIYDIDRGAFVYGKNPDTEREIASCGKIFVAMAVLERGIDLDAETRIVETDREHAVGGARSRLLVGARFRNRDLLAAMLIGSDNRAPTALGRAVGLDTKGLTAAMQKVARRLGLKRTRFSDPSGLKGNISTAREMARAMAAALRHPVIAEMMKADSYEMASPDLRRAIHYNNTNRLLHAGGAEILGGKTGFTNNAGYCLVLAARVDGRRLAMAFLGGDGKLTRFADYRRVRYWLAAADRQDGPQIGKAGEAGEGP